jgi:hypothetical protein
MASARWETQGAGLVEGVANRDDLAIAIIVLSFVAVAVLVRAVMFR